MGCVYRSELGPLVTDIHGSGFLKTSIERITYPIMSNNSPIFNTSGSKSRLEPKSDSSL